MRGLMMPCSRYARLSLGSNLGSGVRVSWRCVETVWMDPRCHPGVFEMHVDHITDEHAMCFDRALMPERRVLLGSPALRMRSVIPLEVLRGGAGMCIILSGRDEQMQVWLLARTV